MFREYRSQRQAVLQLRNADRELRNRTKLQQLEMAAQWQVSSWFSLEIYIIRRYEMPCYYLLKVWREPLQYTHFSLLHLSSIRG